MEQEFTEFSKFRESDKSLNCDQFKDPVSNMCGSILVSYTKGWLGGRFKPFFCNDKCFLSLNLAN